MPVFVNGMGRGHDPRRSRARVLARAVGRAEGGRSRARRGHAARLPARLRPLRRRAGRAPVRRAVARSRRTPTSPRRPRGDLAATFTRSPTSARHPAGARRVDRRSCATTSRPSARRGSRSLARRRARRSSPTRIYGELRPAARSRRDRDRRRRRLRVVRGQARRLATSRGRSSIPGRTAASGMGPGYALAAGLAHPDRQVVLLLGDGAVGFALGDFEALVAPRRRRRRDRRQQRHLGPREAPDAGAVRLRRRRRAAPRDPLRRGRRPRSAATASCVSEPDEIGPALDRAFATKGVSLVNVLTDPADAYPRSSNLGSRSSVGVRGDAGAGEGLGFRAHQSIVAGRCR